MLAPDLALAGTTGSLSGTVTDSTTGKPLANATVSIASPSQSVSVKTDASGHFSFLTLAPDTYTVSTEYPGYQVQSTEGVTVIADQNRVLSISDSKSLKQIGRVTTRAPQSLVKAGTTADVYSITPAQQTAAKGVGGGSQLNTAYSGIATVPGALVTPNQVQGGNGVAPSLYIRGGDYDQVGFEFDGVPIDRSFDQYPSGQQSSLGQQELQVYTGAAPANAEGQGIAGFINQVIKTGTFPTTVSAELGVGGPSFYHKAAVEVSGATKDRRFTYYLGADAYNQEFRYGDQFNGAAISPTYGAPLAPCAGQTQAFAPSCFSPAGQNYSTNVFTPNPAFVLGGYNLFSPSGTKTRDDIANLHYSIPHKDGTRDDIQFLAFENTISTQYYDSIQDQGGVTNFTNFYGGQAAFPNSYVYHGTVGVPLPANYAFQTSQYLYPKLQSPETGFNGTIPADLRNSASNDQTIFKLQYTKSLGSNAFFRLYGYTYYSDWLQYGPQSFASNYLGDLSPDYELNGHARGVSGLFSDQINPQNLISLQGSYTTATSLRNNNTTSYNTAGPLAILVDSNNPTSGTCYTAAGAPQSCVSGASTITVKQAYNAAYNGGAALPVATGTCGTGPCEYFTVGDGTRSTFNTVEPKFYSASLVDQIHPNDKLAVNLGIRLDDYQFVGSDTTATAARTLYYNTYNNYYCQSNATLGAVTKTSLGIPIAAAATTACPTGSTTLNLTNPPGRVTQTYPEFQPRVGATYSLNNATVVRASYGRYTQAPNSAFEQYNFLQQNAPAGEIGFLPLGFTTPNHPVRPQVSNNYDLSFEHEFRGGVSVKVSPFLRSTQDQIQQFYLDQKTNFVSGLNVGRQRSQGVEFELDKGNFANQGLSAKLAFTYTNSYIRYNSLSSGRTIIDPLNAAVSQYNAYTSACAPGGKAAGTAACGATTSGAIAAPCYTVATGAAVTTGACTAADVANPYYNAPLQGLLDPKGNYYTYDLFPGGIGSAYTGYGAPYFATLIVQDKIGRFSVTPNIQVIAGNRFGAPETTFGVDPAACTATLGAPNGDARYNFGTAGAGSAYDAGNCGTLGGGIPDKYTGKFDTIGAFALPTQLSFGTQFTYEFPKVTLTATLSNLVNSCFGGTQTGFSVKGACTYGVIAQGSGGDVGNVYNPGAAIQPIQNTPYLPSFIAYPFSAYFSANFHI